MPLHRRLPKIGFTSRSRTTYQLVNVSSIEQRGLEGQVGPEELKGAGLIRKATALVKILGDGELTRKISVRAHAFSASAVAKIEQAGGDVQKIKD
jgi:large subunit ribosomal protein L15